MAIIIVVNTPARRSRISRRNVTHQSSIGEFEYTRELSHAGARVDTELTSSQLTRQCSGEEGELHARSDRSHTIDMVEIPYIDRLLGGRVHLCHRSTEDLGIGLLNPLIVGVNDAVKERQQADFIQLVPDRPIRIRDDTELEFCVAKCREPFVDLGMHSSPEIVLLMRGAQIRYDVGDDRIALDTCMTKHGRVVEIEALAVVRGRDQLLVIELFMCTLFSTSELRQRNRDAIPRADIDDSLQLRMHERTPHIKKDVGNRKLRNHRDYLPR